ncbi:MAG: sensor histidine kinase [Chloroflexi bacterium]|nr:sensor histidine kinase [Chloroflexota bacterium]
MHEIRTRERFTNRTINIVVVVLTTIAYLPLLLDTDFYQLPPGKIILIVGLGILYSYLSTSGMMFVNGQLDQRPWFMPAYFVIQIIIIVLLFLFIDDLDNNLWMLILPTTAQSLVLSRWGTAVVCTSLLAATYFIYLAGIPSYLAVQILFQIAAAVAFAVLFTYIALRETVARHQIQQLATELHNANHHLSAYAAQAEELATSKERNRLAREIHDNLGHYLTVINVQIEAARITMPNNPAKAEDALNKAQKLTQDGLAAIRQSISALRESPLENQSLSEAINKLSAETQNTGIVTHFIISGDPKPLDSKMELALYRVAQEGLTNIRKHAHASRVDILLAYDDGEMVCLTVADNGVGTAAVEEDGFGLIGIRERVHLLDGQMQITTTPDAGFKLVVCIPMTVSSF